MTDLIIRNVPDEVLAEVDRQAEVANQSRQQYLLSRLTELAEGGPVSMQLGRGFKAYTKTGGQITIRQADVDLSTGAKNLSQEEVDAFKRAKLLASPKNGSRWDEARRVLEAAGFEVFNA